MFNHTVCIYQIATQLDVPTYWITIWLIDDVMLIFVCLLDDLILGYCYSNLTQETGGLKLVLIIAPVLQVNRLIECASHPGSKIDSNKIWTHNHLIQKQTLHHSWTKWLWVQILLLSLKPLYMTITLKSTMFA